MGADLYIEKIHDPLRTKYEPLFTAAVKRRDSLPPKSRAARTAQREVTKYYDLMYAEGYFRDSYNVTNVLGKLGLSWWIHVQPLCQNHRLRRDELRAFRDMVAQATLQLPTTEDIEKQGGTVATKGENSLAEWHKYFVGKHTELLAFLDKAIAVNSDVRCSL